MNVKEAKAKKHLWIGQVKLMGDWLDKHNLPYEKDDVKILPENDEADVEAYEFSLNTEQLEHEYDMNEYSPFVLKEGKVKITFEV